MLKLGTSFEHNSKSIVLLGKTGQTLLMVLFTKHFTYEPIPSRSVGTLLMPVDVALITCPSSPRSLRLILVAGTAAHYSVFRPAVSYQR